MLLSPAGGPHPYYTEHGYVGGTAIKTSPCRSAKTRCGRHRAKAPLTQSSPITLTYDNGKGLKFTRTISVDEKYMFTVDDKVANNGGDPVTVYPYALVSRHGTAAGEGLLHPA